MTENLTGRAVGPYQITSLIGEGGMGQVYLAQDNRLRRSVALKILPARLAPDAAARDRFIREARIAASLDHPHVVPIYEAGEDDGRLFIAMKHIEGCDLRALIAESGPLGAERSLSIIGQAASALDAAHDKGLIHRDVKPANILLVPAQENETDRVFLTDFGVTKFSGSTSLTETGQFIGTPNYMAPEQIEDRALDRRADVYALGCVLYECLTGSVPFERSSDAAVLWAHMSEPAPSLLPERYRLPEELDAVVRRALAKAPGQRHPTCGALAAAAEAVIRSRPDRRAVVVAAPAQADHATYADAPRSRVAAFARGLVATVLTVAVVGSAALMLQGDRSTASGSRTSGDRERIAAQRRHPTTKAETGVRRKEGSQVRKNAADLAANALAPTGAAPQRNGADTDTAAERPVGADRPAAVAAPRTVNGVYTGSVGVLSDCQRRDDPGCLFFDAREGERYLTLEIRDAAGIPVHAYVRESTDGDLEWDGPWTEVCARTSEPILITPGALVNIAIESDGCNGTTARPTRGDVSVTFRGSL